LTSARAKAGLEYKLRGSERQPEFSQRQCSLSEGYFCQHQDLQDLQEDNCQNRGLGGLKDCADLGKSWLHCRRDFESHRQLNLRNPSIRGHPRFSQYFQDASKEGILPKARFGFPNEKGFGQINFRRCAKSSRCAQLTGVFFSPMQT